MPTATGNDDGLIDRTYIAVLLDVSRDCVRKNEIRWGIFIAKVYLNKRCVRYKRATVLRILRQKGFLD
jgi:hypothetical protein